MRYLLAAALAVLLCGPFAPAMAQTAGDGINNSPAPQPRAPVLDAPPPALPGAEGAPGLASAPSVQKPGTGDPTTALFTAINNNNYNAAQDAISRGADLTQRDPLGETPLDLSVALNRNSITFLLLGARNEGGGGGDGTIVGTPVALPAAAPVHKHHHQASPAFGNTAPPPALPANDPGTPDPSAGFLGFGAPKQ